MIKLWDVFRGKRQGFRQSSMSRSSFRKTVQLQEMAASAVCSSEELPQMAARDDVAGLKPSETTRISIYMWCFYL